MMKRLLLALTVLALPLTTHAQTQQKRVSAEITQQAIAEFVPATCRNGLDGFYNEVEQCYMKTNDNDPAIEKCMLGDMTLMVNVHQMQKQSAKLGSEDYTKNIKFVTKDSWRKRFNHYFNLPKFKNLTGEEIADYFIPSGNIISQKIADCLKNKHKRMGVD